MSTIDDIKQRLDIVDIASGYLHLEKSGRYMKALCPFHEEKTPSLFIFPEKQTWRCFGCGAGGDVLSFVMKKEGTDFKGALRILSEKAGIPYPTRKPSLEERPVRRIQDVNEGAAEYYHTCLLENRAAQAARDYVKRRGLSEQVVEEFQLGYCPGDGLRKRILEKGFQDEALLAAGLLREREGRVFEVFRNRLIFPIRDAKRRVLGFGGRALDDAIPKYLNSPQTEVFDKSGILYGLDRAAEAIRETGTAVIVEGYMDVIAAHQHGVKNVVGSMGTALTEKQIKALKALTSRVILALDPDAAGNAATLRGIEVARRTFERKTVDLPDLLGSGSRSTADIRIISLPHGKDPDSLIREDLEEWKRRVEGSLPVVDYAINQALEKYDINTPEGKSKAGEELLPFIAELDDGTRQEFYLAKLARVLEVRDKTLIDMAAKARRTRKEKRSGADSEPRISLKFGDSLEEYCLCILVQHPDLGREADELLPDYFEHAENREVFLAWRQTLNLDECMSMLTDELGEHLMMLVGKPLPPLDEVMWNTALKDCISRLEERWLRTQEEVLTLELEPITGRDPNEDKARRELLQRRVEDLNSRLTRTMRERFQPGSTKARDDG